ncbi:MAG: hypothetical protein IT375_01095 [Polyangiaceae bacterium]|nr:hypothetical protein [Polyangiaceae bacterium]
MVQVDMKKWRPHLRAAKAAGISLARYACEQGLSRHTLYAALRAERDREGVAPKVVGAAKRPVRRAGAAFVPVALAGMSAHLTVRLPNGVVLECHEPGGARLAGLVATLAGLACSG